MKRRGFPLQVGKTYESFGMIFVVLKVKKTPYPMGKGFFTSWAVLVLGEDETYETGEVFDVLESSPFCDKAREL